MWTVSWRGNRRLGLIALAAVLFGVLIGCAATGERIDNRRNAELLARLYPESDYISYLASSSESRQAAEAIARREVSSQISSRLEAESTLVAREIADRDSLHTSSDWTSIIRTRTAFSHAELIRLSADLPGKSAERYQAFAYISRDELKETLVAEYQASAVVFERTLDGLPALRETLPSYAAAFTSLHEAYLDMAAAASMWQAVARVPYIHFRTAQLEMGKAEADRRTLLRDLRLALKVDDCPDLPGVRLSGVVRGALTCLGLGAEGYDCQPAGLLLHLRPEITWSRVMGVRVCTLSLQGELSDCNESRLLCEISISDRNSLSGDGHDPIEKLIGRLTPEMIADLLGAQLRGFLPLLQSPAR